MLEVVLEAQRVSRLTGGAFDITVGPLVDVWGFGPSSVDETPSDTVIQELLAATGYQQLEVDVRAGTLRKAGDSCHIDLSAIAKGYAVDRVAAALDDGGYGSYLVEIGGEVRTRGHNGAGEAWRVGIERPDPERRSVYAAVALSGLSMATSGDYRNFFIRDGVRISHTIDPRTGRPVAHDLASVSVVAASCMTADAFATALEVMGPAEGFEFAERQHISAFFLIRAGDGVFEERRTSQWDASIENSVNDDIVE
jgi:thiamine biosynthesis lipoprotein